MFSVSALARSHSSRALPASAWAAASCASSSAARASAVPSGASAGMRLWAREPSPGPVISASVTESPSKTSACIDKWGAAAGFSSASLALREEQPARDQGDDAVEHRSDERGHEACDPESLHDFRDEPEEQGIEHEKEEP